MALKTVGLVLLLAAAASCFTVEYCTPPGTVLSFLATPEIQYRIKAEIQGAEGITGEVSLVISTSGKISDLTPADQPHYHTYFVGYKLITSGPDGTKIAGNTNDADAKNGKRSSLSFLGLKPVSFATKNISSPPTSPEIKRRSIPPTSPTSESGDRTRIPLGMRKFLTQEESSTENLQLARKLNASWRTSSDADNIKKSSATPSRRLNFLSKSLDSSQSGDLTEENIPTPARAPSQFYVLIGLGKNTISIVNVGPLFQTQSMDDAITRTKASLDEKIKSNYGNLTLTGWKLINGVLPVAMSATVVTKLEEYSTASILWYNSGANQSEHLFVLQVGSTAGRQEHCYGLIIDNNGTLVESTITFLETPAEQLKNALATLTERKLRYMHYIPQLELKQQIVAALRTKSFVSLNTEAAIKELRMFSIGYNLEDRPGCNSVLYCTCGLYHNEEMFHFSVVIETDAQMGKSFVRTVGTDHGSVIYAILEFDLFMDTYMLWNTKNSDDEQVFLNTEVTPIKGEDGSSTSVAATIASIVTEIVQISYEIYMKRINQLQIGISYPKINWALSPEYFGDVVGVDPKSGEKYEGYLIVYKLTNDLSCLVVAKGSLKGELNIFVRGFRSDSKVFMNSSFLNFRNFTSEREPLMVWTYEKVMPPAGSLAESYFVEPKHFQEIEKGVKNLINQRLKVIPIENIQLERIGYGCPIAADENLAFIALKMTCKDGEFFLYLRVIQTEETGAVSGIGRSLHNSKMEVENEAQLEYNDIFFDYNQIEAQAV